MAFPQQIEMVMRYSKQSVTGNPTENSILENYPKKSCPKHQFFHSGWSILLCMNWPNEGKLQSCTIKITFPSLQHRLEHI